jgi:predicted PurR-regulated permease PerM
VLPILGSSLVWLPGAAVLALDQRYGAALLLVAIGALIASNLDNLVRPLVYRRVSNVHPMVTLVGAFAGVRLFGLSGLLLGPLAISYLLELLTVYERELVER